MGKKIRSYEAQRRAAESAVAARLQAHSRTRAGPESVGKYSEFAKHYRDRVETHRGFALRAPELWRCRLRSRLEERRLLELVRFTFARYPVARHLDEAWIETETYSDRGIGNDDFRRWYIIVTQGGSLYKQGASGLFSKLETHHFLNAPEAVGSSLRACWYAFARAQTPHTSIAMRVAQTKIVGFSVASPFWIEAARYFARNPTTIPDMNDLIDFLRAAKEADENFSLNGRSVDALRRRMAEWHRMLRRRDVVCGGSWEGRSLADVEYETGSEHKRGIWRFKQIKTGNDLFREGQRMRHCVVSYKSLCMRGDISIWSLACEYPLGCLNRGVTLEVRNDGAIVQCRGFANRLPYANEVAMVKRWAKEYGLIWQTIEK
jgi:hypothetical protein